VPHKKCNSPEFLTHFIDIYKANACLWNVNSNSYVNKDLHEKAYMD